MKTPITKTLIISLISDDLVNYKLVSGLRHTGLNVQFFYLKLSDTVFNLMGLSEDHKLHQTFYDYYMIRAQEVKNLPVDYERAAVNALAVDIYVELERRKKNARG